MGIRHAGTIIKEARLRAGLTQEQLSEGICSLITLCNIETGKKGISPSTFQALMKKAGTSGEAYPLFKDCKDFDAYMLLKNARIYADQHCYKLAHEELIKLKLCSCGENRLYYQESLLLWARVKYFSGDAEYESLLDALLTALHITLPQFDINNLEHTFLSSVDCEILNLMANIFLDAGRFEAAREYSLALILYINDNIVDDKYTAYIRLFCLFTYSRLLFVAGEHEEADKHLAQALHISDEYYVETYRLEILLLKAINDYCLNPASINDDFLYMLSLASHLGCGYVINLKKIAKSLGIPSRYTDVADPELITFPDFPIYISEDGLSDGSFDIYDKSTLTIGALISKLRKEQHLSLNVLSEGLCSVSKLSKIENDAQYPGIYLTEALLNRLGYSERDFIFHGNVSESEYYKLKNFLLSKYRHGDINSAEYKNKLEVGLKSDVLAVKQLCMLLKNSTDCFSAEEFDALMEALKLSVPNIDLEDFSEKRFSWAEISILNGICVKLIKMGKRDEALKINNMLLLYSRNRFITPGYKNISLFPSYRLHFRYLYNLKQYNQIVSELATLNDEFLFKSSGTASDFFFYSSQAYGELRNSDKMIEHARIAAGYFALIGQTQRKTYLISEIKKQFGVSI